jgi:hypothetical protein
LGNGIDSEGKIDGELKKTYKIVINCTKLLKKIMEQRGPKTVKNENL